MFTGIIDHRARLKKSANQSDGLLLTFARPEDWTDLSEGESVNTNGVCLTVAAIHGNEYDVLAVPETLEKSTFGKQLPHEFNLERALVVQGRIGGHYVQGHVDTVGKVTRIDTSDGYRIRIGLPDKYRGLVIEKGSIAIDGVSLTISALSGSEIEVALIPYTLKHTTISELKAGDRVNLEFDMIGKYVLRSQALKEA